MKKLIFFLFIISVNAFAFNIPDLKTVGDLKAKVLFQSKNLRQVKAAKHHYIFVGNVISKWGEHRYELGVATYTCFVNNSNCQLSNYSRKAMYEKCQISAATIKCSGLLFQDDLQEGSSFANDNPLTYEFDESRSSDELLEWPSRAEDTTWPDTSY